MEELWKTLDFEEGYENYCVSNMGKIKNNRTGTVLKPDVSNMGYERYNLYNSITKKQKKFSVHRLVALYFVEGDTSLVVNHIDGNKRHNVYTNLEWVTTGENNAHAFRTKLRSQDGEKNPTNVHKNEEIHQICKLIKEGLTTEQISRAVYDDYQPKYKSLINHIKAKTRWSSISDDYF